MLVWFGYKTGQRECKENIYEVISGMKMDAQFLNKILPHWKQKGIKKYIMTK